MSNSKESQAPWLAIFLCWIIAVIAMGGSLFFSEVMQFPPCTLCWYQRIAMYPLVPIFLVGLIFNEQSVLKFSVPLIVSGFMISLWHNLLQWELISESATPCSMGVPCSAVYLDWGFITIPFLSLITFSILAILTFYFHKKTRA